MRRVVFLVLLSTLGALIFASVALAITKTCSSSPCFGTAQDDTLTERRGLKDVIYGLSGDDTIYAGLRDRTQPDKDILRGGSGDDWINAIDLDGGDVLYGGRGYDRCRLDPRDSPVGLDQNGCEVLFSRVY